MFQGQTCRNNFRLLHIVRSCFQGWQFCHHHQVFLSCTPPLLLLPTHLQCTGSLHLSLILCNHERIQQRLRYSFLHSHCSTCRRWSSNRRVLVQTNCVFLRCKLSGWLLEYLLQKREHKSHIILMILPELGRQILSNRTRRGYLVKVDHCCHLLIFR